MNADDPTPEQISAIWAKLEAEAAKIADAETRAQYLAKWRRAYEQRFPRWLPDAQGFAQMTTSDILSGPLGPGEKHLGNGAIMMGGLEPIDGADLLNRLMAWYARFLSPPSSDALVAITLWCAHAHLIEAWEATPRLLVCSAEPGSGKTRVLELLSSTAPRTVEAVNVTPSYLFRKVGDNEEGRPTILFDEIDTVFGPKARDNEEIRGLLNAGHRRGAVAGRCVMRGKAVETEEIEAYCAVAMAGLGFVPDTIMTRSVVIRMRRRAANEIVEPFRRRLHDGEGQRLHDQLAIWGEQIIERCRTSYPTMPDEIKDRDADVWEPLISIADAAGGQWPTLARVAAVALVADAKRKPASLGVRLLADLRKVFGDRDQLATDTILNDLKAMDEAPWSDLKGKPLDARALSRILGDYDIKSTTIRVGAATPKGYRKGDLHDAWQRYVPLQPDDPATSATSATAVGDDDFDDWGLP